MPKPPATLIDRRREWDILERMWASDGPELITMVGRRRAGKSLLIATFLRQHVGFLYQATATTERDQLRALSVTAANAFDDPGLRLGAGFQDWRDFIQYMVARANGERFCLVLDELPYLLESVRGFGTLLQQQWDQVLAGTRIKLILTGSYISAMTRLTAADQPLHGRRTRQITVSPFPYIEVGEFVPRYSATDRLITYGTFGGLPGHLALLNDAHTAADNIGEHILDPSGRLADEAEHVLDAFLNEAGVHYSIVRAIAAGERKWSKITSRVGKESASLSRPLEWLQEMGIVRRVLPVTEHGGGSPKRAQYQIADPYLAFWHRFVAPLRASGTVELLTPQELWQRHVAPGLSEYMGGVFETTCRSFVGQSRHPRLPFLPDAVGGWWNETADAEIDVVALGPGGAVLLGECKWGSVTADDLARLAKRRDAVLQEISGVTQIHLALFSQGEVRDRTLQNRIAEAQVLHFSADDLFDRT